MNVFSRGEEEAPIGEGEPVQGLPGWVRVAFSVLAVGVLVMCAILIFAYIKDPQNVASPKDLQLSTVILASLAILFLALVPWHKLGLRIRKVGAIEFETVVNAQAREHAEEFAELRARIEARCAPYDDEFSDIFERDAWARTVIVELLRATLHSMVPETRSGRRKSKRKDLPYKRDLEGSARSRVWCNRHHQHYIERLRSGAG